MTSRSGRDRHDQLHGRNDFSGLIAVTSGAASSDLENVVKEAVCCGSSSEELISRGKVETLGNFVNCATNNDRLLLPKTIGQTFSGLYGFRNRGKGVSHRSTTGGVVTAELSEYVLGVAASQIVLLIWLRM
jgi:hypothetical protein